MKTLRQAVGGYLSLRRSLGFKLKAHERYLREFVSFLKKKRTARSPPNWLYSLQRNLDTNNRRNGPLASVWCAGSRKFRSIMSRIIRSDQRSPRISTEAFSGHPRPALRTGLLLLHIQIVSDFTCISQVT
jgi:hypothetical protein